MSSRAKRESRGSTRGKRESESRSSSSRVKRERDREREPEAASARGSPGRVKREVEAASAREAPAAVPSVRVKREREADEDSEPEREVRGARGPAGRGAASLLSLWDLGLTFPPGYGEDGERRACGGPEGLTFSREAMCTSALRGPRLGWHG